jgi:hypothetical protein
MGHWRSEASRFPPTIQTVTGIDELIAGEGNGSVAIMRQAVPWRCHRSLIGDAAGSRLRVTDIMSLTSTSHTDVKGFKGRRHYVLVTARD